MNTVFDYRWARCVLTPICFVAISATAAQAEEGISVADSDAVETSAKTSDFQGAVDDSSSRSSYEEDGDAGPETGVYEQLTTEVISPIKTRIGRYVAKKSSEFSESDIMFTRAPSNMPFLPLMYLGGSHYGEAAVLGPDDGAPQKRYTQSSSSFAAGLPMLLNKTDAVLLGVYASRAELRLDNAADDPVDVDADRINVNSLALGGGYFSQINDSWQALGFMMPLYHDSDLPGDSSYWQTWSGLFGRYTRSEDLWWAFGVFADSSPFESYVLPYVGFSWVINPEWSVSGIMPWPAITWAPSKDYFWSLGVSYSGTGWAINQETGSVGMSINSFDFGLGFEHRLFGTLWGSISAGVGGLRALQINGGNQVEEPEFDVTSSSFIRLNFTVRPGYVFL